MSLPDEDLNPSFPDNVVGNDDSDVNEQNETNNPYTDNGVLTGFDRPVRYWSNAIGNPGDVIEEDLNFREFVRLNVGSTWYRISPYYAWRADFKFKKAVNGSVWQDNGSSVTLGND